MKTLYIDLRKAELPISTLNDKLLTVLFRVRKGKCPAAPVTVIGAPDALKADLLLPLWVAKEPVTRMLIRRVDFEVGKVTIA